MTATPYFFRRNRDQGRFPYVWAIVTSAVYHPMGTYMVKIYICPLINIPTPEGVIIRQPIFRFLRVIFDGDHDFEGP